jgi:hypothetical protein
MEHITQVLEPIAAEIHEADLEHEAAGVRKAVTESLMFDVHHGAHDPDARHELFEAVVLCKHLTAARVPDAKLAHKAVAAEIQRGLQEYGVVDEGYTELLNQLVSFLTTAGLRYDDGEWVER